MTAGSTIRRFHLTPDRCVLLLLLVEALLFLSNWLGWPAWHKGYAVLTCVAVVGVAMLVMVVWFVVALLFRRRFQFGMWSVLLLAAAIAIPCIWVAVEREKARKQREVFGGLTCYLSDSHRQASNRGPLANPPHPNYDRKQLL